MYGWVRHLHAAGSRKVTHELPFLQARRIAIGAFVDAAATEAIGNRDVIERAVTEEWPYIPLIPCRSRL